MTRNIFLILLFSTSFVASNLAQCWPEGFTHDTRPKGQWLSCERTISPNRARGNGIWIMYDFGEVYNLGTTHIWNYNEPVYTRLGVRRMVVDYSLDGQTWKEFGVAELDLASGERKYEGVEGPDLTGIQARYVLFLVTQTGESRVNCAGLAEVRFNLGTATSTKDVFVQEQLEVFPNPTRDLVELRLSSEDMQIVRLYDPQGKELEQFFPNSKRMRLNLSNYPAGFYLIRAQDKNGSVYQQKITKLSN